MGDNNCDIIFNDCEVEKINIIITGEKYNQTPGVRRADILSNFTPVFKEMKLQHIVGLMRIFEYFVPGDTEALGVIL